VKDIDAVAAEIKAKGVRVHQEPTTIRPGVRICFIRGPQGIFDRAFGARQEVCVTHVLYVMLPGRKQRTVNPR